MAGADRLRETADRALNVIERGSQQDKDYRTQIGYPIVSLSGRLETYGKLPAVLQEGLSEEVSGLVEKARAGDQVAQQILTGVNDSLLKAKIDTKPLPSLDWQVKDQPPKP